MIRTESGLDLMRARDTRRTSLVNEYRIIKNQNEQHLQPLTGPYLDWELVH